MDQSIDRLYLQDGKYLIVKDPNKGILRLYDIPDNTFESEEESEESEEGESPSASGRVLCVLSQSSLFGAIKRESKCISQSYIL